MDLNSIRSQHLNQYFSAGNQGIIYWNGQPIERNVTEATRQLSAPEPDHTDAASVIDHLSAWIGSDKTLDHMTRAAIHVTTMDLINRHKLHCDQNPKTKGAPP